MRICKNTVWVTVLMAAAGHLAFAAETAASSSKDAPISGVLVPSPLEKVSLGGRVGRELDKVVQARIRSTAAAEEIAPEAVEAFRNRVDDRLPSERGLWQGEFWGKWMLSAVAAQRYTNDPQLKTLIRQSVSDLLATQRADGYIGTYHDSRHVEGDCWNLWCRKYTLWGLVEAYDLLADAHILSAACRFMDHLMTEVGPGKIDIVKTGNFAGLPSSSILTPLTGLYRHTNDKRYLEYARYIVERWSKYPGSPPDIVNQGLTGKPVHAWFPEADRWTKAYEFISCVEGLLDLYVIDGDRTYWRAARNICKAIRENERVITGGIGYHDKLDQAVLRTDGLNEPCDVVYWQRLLAKMLQLSGEPRYADEIERLVYNVLLAAMNRDGSWGLRRLGLSEPHLIAPLHCFLHHHHCCVANVPRGLLQAAQVAVMTNAKNGGLAVNLYIPLTASVTLPSGEKLTLRLETDYPESGTVRLTVDTKAPVSFPMKLRIPPWSAQTTLNVNGKSVSEVRPGSYATINRTWRCGDRVELGLDMRARPILFPNGRSHAAVMRGPVVLARSELLRDGDIDEAVALAFRQDGMLEVKRVAGPEGIWMTFAAATTDGQTIRLCDYASTGKDYRKPTDPNAVKEMSRNRTPADLRVWLPIDPGLGQRKSLALGPVRVNADTVDQYEKLELTFDLEATYDNPFDPEQIDVGATFTTPSGRQISVPGFFYQPHVSTEHGPRTAGKPIWKVRFAPAEVGTYSCKVTARNRSKTKMSPPVRFACAPRRTPGWLRVSQTNPRYFEFENDAPFVPCGINLFVGTSLGTPVPPDRLEQCRRRMNRLADARGNFVRLRMDGWFLAIEETPDPAVGYQGLGYYHQRTCWEIDRLYDTAAERGIYVMHCLDNANANVNWKFSGRPGLVRYNHYLKANGGVCESAQEFWSNSEARRYVRNKLRYCVARWGYHPNLMCWEFFNEVQWLPEIREPATAWHREMARYLRSMDPYRHPITTGLRGDLTEDERMWTLPEMDIVQRHYYCRSELVPDIATIIGDLANTYNKPVLLGEYGAHRDLNPHHCTYDRSGIHMHNGMWAALFSGGCGGGAMWYIADYVDAMDLYAHYDAFAGFARRVPWNDGDLRRCQIDRPRFITPPAELHYVDVDIFTPNNSFDKPEQTDFAIGPDGAIAGSESIRKFLFCDRGRKAPPTFHVHLARPAEFVVRVHESVAKADNRVRVYLDGKMAVEKPFPAGRQFNPNSVYVERSGNWITPYDGKVAVTIPAGRHTIRPEAEGGDRIEVEYTLRGAIAFENNEPMHALGFRTQTAAYLWFHNRSSSLRNAWKGKAPIPLGAMTTRVDGLDEGPYNIEWYDTWSGRVVERQPATCSNGALPVTILPLERDIACFIEPAHGTFMSKTDDGVSLLRNGNAHGAENWQRASGAVLDRKRRTTLNQ